MNHILLRSLSSLALAAALLVPTAAHAQRPPTDSTPTLGPERRAADGYFHLGDVNLRLRTAGSEE